MRSTALLFLAAVFAAPLPAATPMPVEGLRVSGKVDHERGGVIGRLGLNQPLQQDDVIRTTGDGRVELGLPSAARLSLGGASELLLHSAEVIAGRSDYLLRARLVTGLARAQALAPGDGPIPDLRLTAGHMRVRVRGADAWLRSDELGDAVCVVEGAVEAQFAGEHVRIEKPGECLRLSAGAREHTVEVLPPKAMAVRLAMTSLVGGMAAIPGVFVAPEPPPPEFPPAIELDRGPPSVATPAEKPALPPATQDPAAINEALAFERQTQAVPSAPAPEPVLRVAPEPAPAPEPVLRVATSMDSGWTLVVASVDSREAADAKVQDLRTQGIEAAVYPAQIKGRTTYRVGVGRHTSADEARGAMPGLARTQPKLKPWPAKF